MAIKEVVAPPPGFRSGQWVKFEFNEKLEICVVNGPKVGRGPLEDPEQVKLLCSKMQTSADGRYVGIHLPAHNGIAYDPVAKLHESGKPLHDSAGKPITEMVQRQVYMPACVAPQRAVLGPNDQQNLEMIWEGKVVTIMLPLDSLRNVEAILLREDLPAHRDETCYPDWNPRPADKVK